MNLEACKPITTDPITFAGWKEVPIAECGEELVPLGAFSPYSSSKVFTESIYYGETVRSPYKEGELMGGLITPFVRKSVAEKLVQVADSLPDNMFLLVMDAYRPVTVQKALFDDLRDQYVAKGASEEEADAKTQNFLSKPSSDPTKPSPHTTGGSVDLTIITLDDEAAKHVRYLSYLIGENPEDADLVFAAEMTRLSILRNNAIELEMGSVFDDLCPEAESAYYEKMEEPSAQDVSNRNHRRLLHEKMTDVGFSNYEGEWWHFDFGNQVNQLKTGQPAIYSYTTPNDTCIEHEMFMQRIRRQFKPVLTGERTLERSDLAATGRIVPRDILPEEPFPVTKGVRAARIVL